MTENEIRAAAAVLANKLAKDNVPFLIIVGVPDTPDSICACNAIHSKADRDHFHRVIDRWSLKDQAERSKLGNS